MQLKDFFSKITIPQEIQPNVFNKELKNIYALEGTSQVNIFVGANNSGKSRLLREIIRSPLIANNFSEKNKQDIEGLIRACINRISNSIGSQLNNALGGRQYSTYSIGDGSRTFIDNNFYSKVVDEILDNNYDLTKFIAYLNKRIKELKQAGLRTVQLYNKIGDTTGGYGIEDPISAKIRGIVEQEFNGLIKNIQSYIPVQRIHRIYIPPARTLRQYAKNIGLRSIISKDYKYDRNERDLVPNAEEGEYNFKYIEIECGENFYKDILNYLTSGHKNRTLVRQYEEFLTNYFFQNKKIELIPHLGDQELHIKIGDEQQQPIYNLGDGLQMLILLTWPFFNYESGIILIEEPELFIHPGLQKRLLKFYTTHKRCENFVFLIATHSNHIIDAMETSDNISIFSLEKTLDSQDKSAEKKPSIIIENIGERNQNALKLLGVSNSSVYLSNCTIWVEGITDKLYLSKYITEYLNNSNPKIDKHHRDKKFQEGIHYSFVYSGGDNIIHWDFTDKTTLDTLSKKIVVRFLCGRAMVIVDDDKNKNPKRKKEISNKLGIKRFRKLPVIEIENLLSQSTIIKAVKSYDSCKTIDEKLIPVLDREKINKTRMGSLIDRHLLKKISIPSRKQFEATGNIRIGGKTINDKLGFCERALEHITYSNMSKESITITKQIVDFIIEHNPGI